MNLKSQFIHYTTTQSLNQIRQGHSVTFIPTLNSIILFGGCQNNQILLFSLSHKRWITRPTQGKRPNQLRYHSCIFQQHINSIIIYGGQIENKYSSKDFYILHLNTWKWKKLFLLHQPPQRQLHTFLYYKNQYFIYGGISLPYKKNLNDLWILKNINNLKINTPKYQLSGCQCNKIDTFGDLPPPNHLQTACIHNRILYVINNHHHKNIFQIYMLSLKSKQWSKQTIKIQQNIKEIILMEQLRCFKVLQQYIIIFCSNYHRQQKTSPSLSLNLNNFQLNQLQLNQIGWGSICLISSQPIFLASVNWITKQPTPLMTFIQEREQDNCDITQSYSLQQYLRETKNEQILSQQLRKKSIILQQLYKQIQIFISKLHNTYKTEMIDDDRVQNQKNIQIQQCIQFKNIYSNIQADLYKVNNIIQNQRNQLNSINAIFGGCLDTEYDDDL